MRSSNNLLVFRVEELEISLAKAEGEITSINMLKDILENRLALLASEIERLSKMVAKKNHDLDELQERLG